MWSMASHCPVANGPGGCSALPLFHWHPPRESAAAAAPIVWLPEWECELGSMVSLLIIPDGGMGAPPAFARQKMEGQFPIPPALPRPLCRRTGMLPLPLWIRRIEWKNHSLRSSAKIMLGRGCRFFLFFLFVFGWSKTDIANKFFYYKVSLFPHGLARENRLFLGLLFSWVWGFSILRYDRK